MKNKLLIMKSECILRMKLCFTRSSHIFKKNWNADVLSSSCHISVISITSHNLTDHVFCCVSLYPVIQFNNNSNQIFLQIAEET